LTLGSGMEKNSGSGMGKNPEPGSGTAISRKDHISKSLVTIIGLKMLKFFVADPDPGPM
jgi:hypothetical protein